MAIKGNLQQYLSQARKINVYTDIWTKSGVSSSYLGITAHSFSTHDHRRHRVALAVRKLPHPYNTENIIKDTVDEVLQEWDIPITKLNIVITDNGSNMLINKEFKQVAYVDSEDK